MKDYHTEYDILIKIKTKPYMLMTPAPAQNNDIMKITNAWLSSSSLPKTQCTETKYQM